MILSCPGGDETRHTVDAEVIRRLGPNGYLINVSRGSVVDETALVHALKSGILGGAALDVYEGEPLPHPELCTLPNTLLTPHIGSGTHETRLAMLRLALDNIRNVLGGLKPLTPVPTQS